MSKLSKLVACGLMAGVVMAGPTTASAADVTIGADVASSYVWRGITLNSDAVVQPSIAVEHDSGLAIEVWSNFDLGDDDGAFVKREFSEIDFDVSYTVDFDMVSLTIGYIEYTFPAAGGIVDEETGESFVVTADREGYISVGAEVVDGLSLDLTAYQNFASSDGTYIVLGAEYGLEVADGLSLALNGSIAYGGEAATAGGKSGMHDYLIGLVAEYEVQDGLSVSAFVNYVGSLDSDVLPDEAVREDVFGGIGVYYSF